jgi:vacuolar-type H+-ATPase subunit H
VNEVVQALTDFEQGLDKIKEEALESKKKLVKLGLEESEKAKAEAIAKAEKLAEERLARAREAVNDKVASIKKAGEENLMKVKATILNQRIPAKYLVIKKLLGE